MAKIPVQVGALHFASKGEAAEHFREMLYRYEIGERIGEPDGTELEWLLERHSEAADKIEIGVDHFSVREAIFGTRCFEVVRRDGSTTDFSFKNCVDGKAPSAQAQIFNAMRAAVTSDILDKKRAWFTAHGDAEGKVACAITGMRVTFEESHADHAPPRPFGTLAASFLQARKLPLSLSLVTASADNQYQPRLADSELEKAWVEFHHAMAVIRVVAKGENLRTAHEGRVKKRDRQLRLDE
jgi:hypothetical protein